MIDAAALQRDFRRYEQIIYPLISSISPFVAQAEDAMTVQVERGIILPSLLARQWGGDAVAPIQRLIDLSRFAGMKEITVVDRGGHHRAIYRPLLIYAWLQAYRLAYETMPPEVFGQWEEGLRPWCDLLENRLGEIDWPAEGFAAPDGATAAEAAWIALALHVAGKVFVRDAWTDLAGDVFGKVARGQTSSGAFLRATPADSIETQGYDELVLLHAAASYAVQAADRSLSLVVAKNAEFHLHQLQPDHATMQPWAVFAFIWQPTARPLADQMLHAASVQQSAGSSEISSILLADALYCLRLFL